MDRVPLRRPTGPVDPLDATGDPGSPPERRHRAPNDGCTGRCSRPWPTWPPSGTDVIDLKVADSALAEMAEAFRVFRPFRRRAEGDHLRLGPHRAGPSRLPVHPRPGRVAWPRPTGWWSPGPGPGIMAAGMEGAGRDKSIGVNIRLPFEQGANTFIAQDPKLVEMRYFFTRKLMLIKESDGYVVLPGGFGTLDEGFELLTLLQTGKAEPAPVVMLDVPGGTYWERLGRSSSTTGRAARPDVARRPVTVPRSPTTSRRPPPRSSASTATTTRAAGSATSSSCGCGRPRTGPSWPSSTREFADIVAERDHAPDQAPPARALRPRPSRPRPPGRSASTRSTTGGSAS